MGGEKWEMGGEKWEVGGEKWEVRNGRREAGRALPEHVLAALEVPIYAR